MSAVMWLRYVLSLKQVLYMVPIPIKRNFHLYLSQKNVLFPKPMVSLRSPEQLYQLLALMPLNSLITCDYNMTSDVLPAKNQVITINEACRSVDWVSTSFLLWAESLVQVLCENGNKIMWCPIRHETHVLSNFTLVEACIAIYFHSKINQLHNN
jgi:hypothetical protein